MFSWAQFCAPPAPQAHISKAFAVGVYRLISVLWHWVKN